MSVTRREMFKSFGLLLPVSVSAVTEPEFVLAEDHFCDSEFFKDALRNGKLYKLEQDPAEDIEQSFYNALNEFDSPLYFWSNKCVAIYSSRYAVLMSSSARFFAHTRREYMQRTGICGKITSHNIPVYLSKLIPMDSILVWKISLEEARVMS